MADSDDAGGEYKLPQAKRQKKRKTEGKSRRKAKDEPFAPVEHLLTNFDNLFEVLEGATVEGLSLEPLLDPLLPELLQDRARHLSSQTELTTEGRVLRPPTRAEAVDWLNEYILRDDHSLQERLVLRKLRVEQERRIAGCSAPLILTSPHPGTAEPLHVPSSVSINQDVLNGLHAIRTTPYETSFLSRLMGTTRSISDAFFVDWHTKTPWMAVLQDVRDHFKILHPDRCQSMERPIPIVYTFLQPEFMDQVHDLLVRSFWSGVGVKDSLDYSPERCTVVAVYGKIVVGVAILSSPRETYITYLAVRHGWEQAQIATKMLHQLIVMNPNKDISLHVSVNNPAMLLYNRFGFKAEEFVAGFYEAYLDSNSRASMNAFRLRLRHLQ